MSLLSTKAAHPLLPIHPQPGSLFVEPLFDWNVACDGLTRRYTMARAFSAIAFMHSRHRADINKVVQQQDFL
jgi:hypothetical protein